MRRVFCFLFLEVAENCTPLGYYHYLLRINPEECSPQSFLLFKVRTLFWKAGHLIFLQRVINEVIKNHDDYDGVNDDNDDEDIDDLYIYFMARHP